MAAEPQPAVPAEQAELEAQMTLYAKELHDLYQQEKKEREALAEEKLVLEYRLKELSALNALFQRYLERQQRLEEAMQETAASLRQVIKQSVEAGPRGKLERLLGAIEAILASAPKGPLPAAKAKPRTRGAGSKKRRAGRS